MPDHANNRPASVRVLIGLLLFWQVCFNVREIDTAFFVVRIINYAQRILSAF